MKLLSFSVFFLLFISANAQKENESLFLKEISQNACSCMDSIRLVTGKTPKSIREEVGECIHKQVMTYQIGIQLINTLPDKKDFKNTDELIDSLNSKKDIEIAVSSDRDSQFYKKHYNELERELMDNCPVIKELMASNDDVSSDYSVSQNSEARRYYSLGIQEYKDGNYEKARDYYLEALRIDSKFAFAWDNLGLSYRRLGQNEKAIEAYQESLKLDPEGVVPLQNIALTYKIVGQYEKSIEAYEHLGRIYPDEPEVFYGLGQIYSENLGDSEKGLENACKALKLYAAQGSPYRSDAEIMILNIYDKMKKDNQEARFHEILKRYDISFGD